MAKALVTSPVTKSNPRWAKDYGLVDIARAHFPAKLDPTLFNDRDAVTVALTANAAQNATSLSINAITFTGGASKIPAGTNLYFGGTKIATLSADYTGGTSVLVNAIPTAINSGDSAVYSPFGLRKAIDSGTLVGRTYLERDSNQGFGPAVNTDDEIYLLIFDIPDANNNNDCELYRHGRTVAENLLPNWAAISANSALLTVLRSKYVTIKGA